MKVVFTPFAERQVDALHLYISGNASSAVADGFIGRVVAYCERLGDFPVRGTPHYEILPGLRTVGFERRVTIAFIIEPKLVLIEGVFHGGQDYAGRLRRDR